MQNAAALGPWSSIFLISVVFLTGACTSAGSTGSVWVEGPAMQIARSEHPAVVLDGDIVVIGGLVERRLGGASATTSVEAFDGDAWRRLSDLPEARHHVAAAVVEDRLFVLGGFEASGFRPVTTVWELSGDDWVERAPLPSPIGAGAAAVVDGLVYLVGGVPDGAMWRYDPQNDDWERLADPTTQREHLAAVPLDGEVWALGGRWNGDAVASTEIYDPISNSWRPGPSMSARRSGFGATAVDDSIVVAGGEVFDPIEALGSAERLVDGEWHEAESLPYGLHGNPLVEVDGVVLLPGGSERPGGVDNRGSLLLLED